MDKCSIFLMIVHTFSCRRSVLKCLTKENAVSPVRFVLYAKSKTKTDKKILGGLNIYRSRMLANFFL